MHAYYPLLLTGGILGFFSLVLIVAYAVVWMQSVLAFDGFGYMPLLAMIPLFLSLVLPMFTLAFYKQK